MPILIIILFFIIGFAELKPLVKTGDKKGFWISLILLSFSCVILTLRSMDITVPSPVKPMVILIQSLLEKS